MSNPTYDLHPTQEPAYQPTVVDAVPAAEAETRGDYILGTLAGRRIFVPPVKKWRSSALASLRDGDMQGWAESCLDDQDLDIWDEVDPTLQEIEDFFGTVNHGLGTNPGNSRASRRSSRNTARR